MPGAFRCSELHIKLGLLENAEPSPPPARQVTIRLPQCSSRKAESEKATKGPQPEYPAHWKRRVSTGSLSMRLSLKWVSLADADST